MKNTYEPLFKEKNKKEENITFVPFPGYEVKGKTNFKKTIILFSIILVLIMLLILSSVINYNKFDNNYKSNYVANNKTVDAFATIHPDHRTKLFNEIGFDNIKTETKMLNGKNYTTTYAYNKIYKDAALADSISVFYNDNDKVNYIILNLIYKKSDFSYAKVESDANNILSNFTALKVKSDYVKNAFKNDYYYSKFNNGNITYSYSKLDNNYCSINLVVEK